MPAATPTACVAFDGERLIASGPLTEVAIAAWRAAQDGRAALVLDAETSRPVDLDLRGSEAEMLARLPPGETPKRGPGRPKLGVVAREVTLLPQQWDWLNGQPGGASVALRKLVETARKSGREETRRNQEAAYRFMTVLAGDRPGYEEAVRALYAGDGVRLAAQTEAWPADIRRHARALAGL